ncbi:hypothetical protein BGZ47_006740, partial [Haplosporangium gracile]
NAAPYEKAITFDKLYHRSSFNSSKKSSISLNYEFELRQGEVGRVGMVNVQISMTVKLITCPCPMAYSDAECEVECQNIAALSHNLDTMRPSSSRMEGRLDSRTAVNLNATMQKIITNEMNFNYSFGKYGSAVVRSYPSLAGPNEIWAAGGIVFFSPLTIELIPVRQSPTTLSVPRTCAVFPWRRLFGVSKTYNVDFGIAIELSGKVFGADVAFTASVGYGFSTSKEKSTNLTYTFNLLKGDVGYVGMANVQISAKTRVRGCKRGGTDWEIACRFFCTNPNHPNRVDETKHHEVVIVQNGNPKSVVAFIPWSLKNQK